jgi:hypothetical protein
MNEPIRRQLARELAGDEPESPREFLSWWGRAARLAALGDASAFERWPALVKRLGIDLDATLRERAQRGAIELDTLDEEALALAIIDAQDIAFALQQSRDILPRRGRLALEDWIARTSDIDTDAEATFILDDWRQRHGFEPDTCLGKIGYPVSGFERYLIAQLSPAYITIAEPWPVPQVGADFVEKGVLLADDDAPSALRRQWYRELEIFMPDGRQLRITRGLNEDWEVVVVFEGAVEIAAVSLGSFGLARTSDEDEERWHAEVGILPRVERVRRLESPLRVRTRDGYRLVLS